MPDSDRHRRPRRRLLALAATSAVLGAVALGAPTTASAYQQHFCQYQFMPSGTNCFAQSRHTLQNVFGYTIGSSDRICAASFTTAWGTQNSDWRCEYEYVHKILGGRVEGVGAIRNGDPQAFVGYAVQEF
jgi:hypothetical protein